MLPSAPPYPVMATQLVLDAGKHFKCFQERFCPVTEIKPSLATYNESLSRKTIISVAFNDCDNAQLQSNEANTKPILIDNFEA